MVIPADNLGSIFSSRTRLEPPRQQSAGSTANALRRDHIIENLI